MAKGDTHMAKNVAKESCCIAPTLIRNIQQNHCSDFSLTMFLTLVFEKDER
jgi:hypothetical protein